MTTLGPRPESVDVGWIVRTTNVDLGGTGGPDSPRWKRYSQSGELRRQPSSASPHRPSPTDGLERRSVTVVAP
jgi:hypothetical protein